jgi:hypothetical protein
VDAHLGHWGRHYWGTGVLAEAGRSAVKDRLVGNVVTVCLACVGGFLGHLGFGLLLNQGFYAMILPGGLIGLAAGVSRSRSLMVPVLCGILAIVAGLLTEFRYAPFLADSSLNYFLLHALDLRPVTLLLIGLGGVIGFWVPFRRRIDGRTDPPRKPSADG